MLFNIVYRPDEWRKSALDCLEFIDWQKLVNKQPGKDEETAVSNHIQIEPPTTATAALIKSAINLNPNGQKSTQSQKTESNDKNTLLILMNDHEIYNLLQDYYSHRHKSHFYFLDDSFQPLFTNILSFIRKTQYEKALEILNLGTLLLLKQTQAELKRLLKFLYLTANSSHAPKLSDTVTFV
jgi:hypothetical protein